MCLNKSIVVIFVLAVFTCSLYAIWPAVQTEEEKRDMRSRALAVQGEYLLLTHIRESDYNSRATQLPALELLTGIGDFAKITMPHISASPSFCSHREKKWYSLYVCSPDLSVFLVSVSKPESLNVAFDLIMQRTSQGFSKPAVDLFKPKLEDGNYSLSINTERYIGLTRLSIERGLLIGVDFRSILQPLEASVNGEAILAQMNELMDDLIAWVDGDNKITDEKEEHYNKIKSAYRALVPGPHVVEDTGERGPSIWETP